MRRNRRILDGPQGPLIRLNGRDVINFCSNDYLGLANHPALIAAMKQGLDQYGLGAGASQLVCGYTSAHRQLEEKLSGFTGRQKAITFSSGYMANLAIVNALAGKADVVIGDRLNHASMTDAALLSPAKFRRYQHGSSQSLNLLLKNTGAAGKLVMTDGVFSMDGDIAPLQDIAAACTGMNAMLVVDDAHGFGVLGEKGGGTIQHFNLGTEQVPILMATFGKALGTFGAFVAGDEDIIEQFVQSARTLIYTTATPPALAVATMRALDLMSGEQWRRDNLFGLVKRFKLGAHQLGLPVTESETPIQPLIIGAPDKTVEICSQLLDKGIYVAAIRPPTVPKGTSRLRITLTAGHSEAQVDQLLEALHDLV